MAEPTRLAKLPGYDTAPDVYETPETATDTSTITTSTTNETPSDSATSEDESLASDEDGPFGGISHRRLFPERARSRFQSQGGRVEVKGLDLSDRVDGRRRGLQVRLRRTGADGNEETLEARIARLRKEVEECRVLAEERDAEAEGVAVHELGKMLIELEAADKPSIPAVEEPKNLPPLQEQSAEDIVPLAKIAAFDARLTGLERAVGISSMDIDADGSFTAPVLPSLSLLDQQISALMTSTSIAQLDAASTRIRKLAQEADRLAQSQGPADADDDAVKDTMAFTQDERTKLGGLYALLPSLQGLSPTVPAVIERLRSLTALHSGAANAASELDAVVKKQADMDAELKSWEVSLERLEGVVKNALEANGRNGKFVEGWVQDLQKRTEALR